MIKNKKTISIVLATFNGETFLEKLLASLANQSFLPHELIVSDDGSQDATNEIVSKFEKSAPFKVIRLQNSSPKGFRENFLYATAFASGDWISFCDQDDIWQPDKLELCSQHMDVSGITQIVHRATLIDDKDFEIGLFEQNIKRNCLNGPLTYDVWGTFLGFSMLVDKRIFNYVNSNSRFVDYIDPSHKIAHDRWAFFLAQTLGNTFELAKPLVAYRQHSNNVFGSKSRKKKDESYSALAIETAAYIEATKKMVEIVANLPTNTNNDFPFFDRDRSIEVYTRALSQLNGRAKIYNAHRFFAPTNIFWLFLNGGYRNAHNKSVRWRSIVRDLKSSLVKQKRIIDVN